MFVFKSYPFWKASRKYLPKSHNYSLTIFQNYLLRKIRNFLLALTVSDGMAQKNFVLINFVSKTSLKQTKLSDYSPLKEPFYYKKELMQKIRYRTNLFKVNWYPHTWSTVATVQIKHTKRIIQLLQCFYNVEKNAKKTRTHNFNKHLVNVFYSFFLKVFLQIFLTVE